MPIRDEVRPVDAPIVELGEGPCWDVASSSLFWTDIPAGRIHRLDPAGRHASWEAGQPVGAIAPRESGGLALAAGDGFHALDTATGALTRLADAGHPQAGLRMNDGACDRAGRFYAGSMAVDERPGAGALYRLDPDGRVSRLVTGVGISNGIGWSPGGAQMYYIDSLAYRLDVFDYDAATGEVGNRRGVVGLGRGDVMPDGLAVDEDGCIWVALWGGWAVHRYRPDGHLADVLPVPAANVTCPAFGGSDLRTLYITTAAGPGEAAGALYSCQPGVAGLPTFPYRG